MPPAIPATVSGLALLPVRSPLVSTGALVPSVDLALFFLVGVLAGAHCLGMCGPLVSTYADRISAQQADARADRLTLFDVRQQGLFNLGRTVGYTAVGAILGLAGSGLTGVATITPLAATIRGSVGIVVGTLILVAGAGYLLRGTTTATTLSSVPGLGTAFQRVTRLLTARIDRVAGSTGIVGLGTVHALLPCPILYPAYLYAFAVADPIRGAAALGLLGLGTIPTLLAYGLALGSLSVGHRHLLHRGMGVLFLALGYLPLAHGLMLFGVELPYPDVPYYQPL